MEVAGPDGPGFVLILVERMLGVVRFESLFAGSRLDISAGGSKFGTILQEFYIFVHSTDLWQQDFDREAKDVHHEEVMQEANLGG